ncbi:MAG: bifunctional oligoribonuclease/PAP phosphatase NrnA, partial [Nitrospinota bacterium]
MELNNAIDFIKEKDNFLITTHVNPDGDGVGSILGLIGLLKRLKKKYLIVFHDPPQEKLSFMERIEEVRLFDESMTRDNLYDNAIIIDVPHLDRIGDVVKLLKKDAQILNIDHHVSNERYGTSNLIEPSASSSAEIIGSIFERMNVEMDHASAQAIYVGLSVDTGRFRFNNTSPEVFRLAERLIKAGVRPDIVSDKLYFNTN